MSLGVTERDIARAREHARDPEGVLESLELLYRSRMEGISVELVYVTPEDADGLLRRNFTNRRVSPTSVSRYSRALAEGEWRVTSDGGIGQDRDGRLQNGQHRLTAVARTGIGAPFLFVRGLEPEAQDVTDDGAKRTFANQLEIRGEHHANALAAAVRLVWMWREGIRPLGKQLTVQPTKPQLLACLEAEPALRDAVPATRGASDMRLLPGSLAACLFHLFSEHDRGAAGQFFNALVWGVGLEQDDPILLLRNVLIKTRDTKGSARAKIDVPWAAAVTIKTWNAWRLHRPIRQLRWVVREAFPELEDEQ